METSSKVNVEAIAAELPPIPERKGFTKFWTNPTTQVAMVSLVCFGCPGMFKLLVDDVEQLKLMN